MTKRFTEFINTADEDLAREVIAPDAVFHAPSHAEPLRGPEGYLEIIAMMRGTHEGKFFGIPATGNKIAVQAMNFYYLADGRIVKERGQPDLLGPMQQIGAVPAP